MRLRHITGCEDFIHEAPECIEEQKAKELKGNWQSIYKSTKPLHIEIGMGKGLFIRRMAYKYPEVNFLGIERYTTILMKAIQRSRKSSEENDYSNLYYAYLDAKLLSECFEKGEIEKIYLNFSDPWPKARHSQRRLTSKQFLDSYAKVLDRGALIEFKTDNIDLFNFSLEELEDSDFELIYHTYDLHADENMDNVMSEYEEKFSSKGQHICKLIARRK